MKQIQRVFVSAAAIIFLCGWSPPVDVLDGSVQMLFQTELRDLLLSPKDIATTCVKHRNGQVSYEQGKSNSLYITCRVPQQAAVDAHTIRFHLFVSSKKFDDKHFTALAGIHALAPTQARGWIQFSAAERNTMMKSIRDLLLDDDTIKEIEEGHDAFGDWRVCKNHDDVNCYRRMLSGR